MISTHCLQNIMSKGLTHNAVVSMAVVSIVVMDIKGLDHFVKCTVKSSLLNVCKFILPTEEGLF